jgi:lipid-binding SYLF domain-containing protein
MVKHLLIVSVAGLGLGLPALASDRADDTGRIQKVTQVFQEIMRTPDQGVPQELLESAKCVGIIPGEEKAAFIFGGNYGKGLATCRTSHGWSAPMFLAIGAFRGCRYCVGAVVSDLEIALACVASADCRSVRPLWAPGGRESEDRHRHCVHAPA